MNETYELTVARQFADQHAEFNKQSGQAVSLLEFVQDHYPRAKELIKNVFAFFLNILQALTLDVGMLPVMCVNHLSHPNMNMRSYQIGHFKAWINQALKIFEMQGKMSFVIGKKTMVNFMN